MKIATSYKNKKLAIFVECKSSISTKIREHILDGYEAIENILENKKYLEDSIGNEIKLMEFVFCVPAGANRERLVRKIENMENSGKIDELSAKSHRLMKKMKEAGKLDYCEKPRFLIWELNLLKRECLNLFTRIDSRKEKNLCRHKDTELANLLYEGISAEKGNELFVRTHPSSHPYSKGFEVISKIFDMTRDKEEDKREFSYDFVKQFFQDKSTISHYASDIMSNKLTKLFITKSLDFDIIEKIDNSKYRLKLRGKKRETVKENYKRKYFEGAKNRIASKLAEERVVKEFKETYTDLDRFLN